MPIRSFCRSFNPCRVFSFAATQLALQLCTFREVVSIPVGFSRSLRLEITRRIFRQIQVSIPVGFSRSLRPLAFFVSATVDGLFQSLSGFLVRCDAIGHGVDSSRETVSIPVGFSRSLRQNS